ncbi:hypothetical protein ILUMI_16545, partial [Ignelater luminosus]
MSFKYQRKSNRTLVSPERMKRVAKEVVLEERPLRETAKIYGIDKMTVLRRF